MESKFFQKYFIYFVLYAIFGWLYETVLEVFIYDNGFSNRGFLFGPWCIIYGFGALLLIFLLKDLKGKQIKIGPILITPILVFLGVMFIATTVELIGSYLMEWTLGDWMWNYKRFDFDFQGRIALNPSIRFGFGGMIFIYILQPIFEKITNRMSDKTLDLISIMLGMIFIADFIYTLFLR